MREFVISLAGVAAGAVAIQPRGELPGTGSDKVRVQQAERLKRDRGGRAARAGGDDRRCVEHLEQAVGLGALLLEIDRPACRTCRTFRRQQHHPSRCDQSAHRALPGDCRARPRRQAWRHGSPRHPAAGEGTARAGGYRDRRCEACGFRELDCRNTEEDRIRR